METKPWYEGDDGSHPASCLSDGLGLEESFAPVKFEEADFTL